MSRIRSISDDGYITWHCATPTCKYHDCAGSHRDEECPHHEGKDVKGTPHTVHVSHEDVQHVRRAANGALVDELVRLPMCECGAQLFVKVKWTEEELQPPIIKRDEQGKIIDVIDVGASNFTVKKKHVERKLIPFETARLKLGNEHRIVLKDGVAYEEVWYTVIDDAYVAPWIAHHLKLGEMMKQHGKGPED